MRMLVKALAVVVVTIAASVSAVAAPSVDGLLAARINASPLSLTPVVITFDHKVTNNDFLMLQSLGIRGGRYTQALPIVLTSINRTQFNT
jgi:hypothetical protein